ncbi:MAG: hypothetical protein EPO57_03870 [Chitinophagaceae bacterium]|nr:MAG: hypothetical protein EPO57_03870 [Chitinophagaceae bacterium]
MKNSFITASVIAISSILFLSCNKSNENAVAVDFSNMKIDLSQSKLGKLMTLVEYNNIEDLSGKLNNQVNLMINDSRELIVDTPSISNVMVTINFSSNKAVITSFYFLNEKNRGLSYGYVWDNVTQAYLRVGEEGGDGDAPSCPAGYTELAVCGNLSNPEACVAAAITAYLTANLPPVPGSCANVQVIVGTFKTTVCGKKC